MIWDKVLGLASVALGGANVYELATGAQAGAGRAALASVLLAIGFFLILRGVLKETR